MEFSTDKWQELCLDLDSFESDFRDVFGCNPVDVTESTATVTRSRELSVGTWFEKFAEMFERTRTFTAAAASKIEELNSQVIKGQAKVITLQEELLKNKDDQLASVRTTVRDEVATVNSAVITEIRSSWSKVVAQGRSQPITTASLKEAVKSAVSEEDKSRNFVIFGKAEEVNEDVANTVDQVLRDINEKPRVIECIRIGTPANGKPRPIKVKLPSSDAVLSVLRNAKALKDSNTNKATFIGPDRSKEERAAHKKLVEKMRAKMKEEPENYHYIQRGMVISVKKTARTNTQSD
jgi:hypothetical protein